MNLFDEVDENLFRPLTGINKRKYVDILALIWDKCKRMPMYAIEKSTIFDMVEDYFYGLDEQVELDIEEQEETDGNIVDTRVIAVDLSEDLGIQGGSLKKKASTKKNPSWPLIIKLCHCLNHFKK